MPSKPTIPRTCQQCGVSFLAVPSEVRRRGARYCSRSCRNGPHPERGSVVIKGDGTALVPLRAKDGTITAHAIIDESDAIAVEQWRWSLGTDGYAVRSGHVNGSPRGIRLHRELLGLTHGDGVEGDHINRDKLDNRRLNLRVTTRRQNSQNRDSNQGSSSQFRGVYFATERGYWVAHVTVDTRTLYLGRFDSEEEAAEVARAARLRMLPYAVD